MFLKSAACLLLLVGLVAAEVPSYIHVCSRRDPNLDQCVIDSTNSLKGRLAQGIPEMGIPPSDPWLFDKIILIDLPNLFVEITNVRIVGFKDLKINNVHIDLQNQQNNLDLNFDHLIIDARYNVTAKILVPISGTGDIHIVPAAVNAKLVEKFKIVKRDGKEYLHFTSIKTKITLDDYDVEMKSDRQNPAILTAISQVLGSSKGDIIKTISPHIEKVISQLTIDNGNKITSKFTYDELFPDTPV